MSSKFVTLSSDNYDSVTKSKGIVIVKFSTPRCIKCKKISEWCNTELVELRTGYAEKLLSSPPCIVFQNHIFGEADLDEVFEFDEVDTITSVPAFVKYVDGVHVATVCSDDKSVITNGLKLLKQSEYFSDDDY
jgi:hypothetical protein